MAVFGLVEAMKEADDAAKFSKLHKNPMANVKACELRAKLSGLLIDRIEVVPVDLRGALEAAESRVINVTPLSLASMGSIDWRSHIPGTQVADPEAGPADGQARS